MVGANLELARKRREESRQNREALAEKAQSEYEDQLQELSETQERFSQEKHEKLTTLLVAEQREERKKSAGDSLAILPSYESFYLSPHTSFGSGFNLNEKAEEDPEDTKRTLDRKLVMLEKKLEDQEHHLIPLLEESRRLTQKVEAGREEVRASTEEKKLQERESLEENLGEEEARVEKELQAAEEMRAKEEQEQAKEQAQFEESWGKKISAFREDKLQRLTFWKREEEEREAQRLVQVKQEEAEAQLIQEKALTPRKRFGPQELLDYQLQQDGLSKAKARAEEELARALDQAKKEAEAKLRAEQQAQELAKALSQAQAQLQTLQSSQSQSQSQSQPRSQPPRSFSSPSTPSSVPSPTSQSHPGPSLLRKSSSQTLSIELPKDPITQWRQRRESSSVTNSPQVSSPSQQREEPSKTPQGKLDVSLWDAATQESHDGHLQSLDATRRSRSNENLNGAGLNEGRKRPVTVFVKNDTCMICMKVAYPMEKIEADKKVFHKTCFRCARCHVILQLGNYAALNGEFYCKPHLLQLFTLKGNFDEGFGRQPRAKGWVKEASSPEV